MLPRTNCSLLFVQLIPREGLSRSNVLGLPRAGVCQTTPAFPSLLAPEASWATGAPCTVCAFVPLRTPAGCLWHALKSVGHSFPPHWVEPAPAHPAQVWEPPRRCGSIYREWEEDWQAVGHSAVVLCIHFCLRSPERAPIFRTGHAADSHRLVPMLSHRIDSVGLGFYRAFVLKSLYSSCSWLCSGAVSFWC